MREAEENGESEDLNGKGAGPADDKCFLCQKVILMLIMMMVVIMLMVVLYCRNDGEGTTPLCLIFFALNDVFLQSDPYVLRRGLCKECTDLNQKMIEVINVIQFVL